MLLKSCIFLKEVKEGGIGNKQVGSESIRGQSHFFEEVLYCLRCSYPRWCKHVLNIASSAISTFILISLYQLTWHWIIIFLLINIFFYHWLINLVYIYKYNNWHSVGVSCREIYTNTTSMSFEFDSWKQKEKVVLENENATPKKHLEYQTCSWYILPWYLEIIYSETVV